MQGIYSITNKINGKIYIGSSIDIEKRWGQHKSNLNRGIHTNQHLQSAWDVYGENSFVFNVVEEVENNLIECEQKHMDFNNACDDRYGYNIIPFADRHSHSEETKKKMLGRVPWNKGKKNEYKLNYKDPIGRGKRISSGKTGKHPYTDEMKLKMRNAHLGKKLSAEQKKKISNSLKASYQQGNR